MVLWWVSIVFSLFTTKHISCAPSNDPSSSFSLPSISHAFVSRLCAVNVMMRHLLYLKNEPFFMRLIRNFISARVCRRFLCAFRLNFVFFWRKRWRKDVGLDTSDVNSEVNKIFFYCSLCLWRMMKESSAPRLIRIRSFTMQKSSVRNDLINEPFADGKAIMRNGNCKNSFRAWIKSIALSKKLLEMLSRFQGQWLDLCQRRKGKQFFHPLDNVWGKDLRGKSLNWKSIYDSQPLASHSPSSIH